MRGGKEEASRRHKERANESVFARSERTRPSCCRSGISACRHHQDVWGVQSDDQTLPQAKAWVLLLNMVDNSRSLSKPLSGRFFVIGQSGQTFSSRSEAPSNILCGHSYPPASDMALQPPLDLEALKRKPAARGVRAPRVLSIAGWFCRLPWLVSVADSVVPEVCPLALEAVPAPFVVIGGGARNDSTHATTPGGPTGVGTAEPSPTCGVRELPPHGGRSDSPAR